MPSPEASVSPGSVWQRPIPELPLRCMQLLPPGRAQALRDQLIAELPWNDGSYLAGGRRFALPRLQSWHADPGVRYRYADNLCNSHPWSPLLQALRREVEAHCGTSFNAVLANLYRDGADRVGWHADDEPDLGPAPLLASLSLGATRAFCIRSKNAGREAPARWRLALGEGQLLIMEPPFQRDFEHAVEAESEVSCGRLNLSFRRILSDTEPT